ncbi:charged multivesicular body protein 1 [Sarotherodon galilaeus]
MLIFLLSITSGEEEEEEEGEVVSGGNWDLYGYHHHPPPALNLSISRPAGLIEGKPCWNKSGASVSSIDKPLSSSIRASDVLVEEEEDETKPKN